MSITGWGRWYQGISTHLQWYIAEILDIEGDNGDKYSAHDGVDMRHYY